MLKCGPHNIMSLLNTREKMVRTLNAWNTKTFGKAFSEIVLTDKNRTTVELLSIVLEIQSLSDKPMNGFCSEGLIKDEFEDMGVAYVDFFKRLDDAKRFWTPLDILFEVCKNNLSRRKFYEEKAKKYKTTFERITCLMCGRALRALPSYIREPQLYNAFERAFPHAAFSRSSELDKKFHCDIKMTLDGVDYYIWSFIASPKSMGKFMEKFGNQRKGNVPDGYHILCPFDRYGDLNAQYLGWGLYSKEYINEVKTAIYQTTPLEYDTVMKSLIARPKVFKRPIVVSKNASVPVRAEVV